MSTGGIEAIVMAGGKGKRLLPYTTILPKPLMPLGDATVLEHLLRTLQVHGIRRICLAVNHLRHLIQDFFGDGQALGLSIEYVVENVPLGTCGPVSQILDQMADSFLLLNGDLVTNLNLADVLADHERRGSAATVAVLRRRTQLDYGVLDTDTTGRITAIREKPITDHLINMGVYAIRRESLRPFVRPGHVADMPDVLSAMVADGRAVHAFLAECEWLDIGRPEDYARALRMVADAPMIGVET